MYVDAVAVVPNDGVDLPTPSNGLYIGVGGNVTIVSLNNTTTLFVGVLAGTTLEVGARRVKSTGTTATSIVALS